MFFLKYKYYKFLLWIFIMCSLLIPNVVCASVSNQEQYIINNNGLIIYDREYNNLKNLGFTELEILNMTKEELDQNKNLNGKIVAQNIIETGIGTNFNQSVDVLGVQPGITNTTSKKLTTTIISVNGKYRYKSTLEWKDIPSNRSYDIIGIGIDSNVKVNNNIFFKNTYCTSKTSCTSSTSYTKKTSSTGASATYLLPSSKSIISMSVYLYFDVVKNTTSTITKLNAYGDYAHSTKSVSKENVLKHSISRTGIAHLNSTSNYFDTFNISKAVWTGKW